MNKTIFCLHRSYDITGILSIKMISKNNFCRNLNFIAVSAAIIDISLEMSMKVSSKKVRLENAKTHSKTFIYFSWFQMS